MIFFYKNFYFLSNINVITLIVPSENFIPMELFPLLEELIFNRYGLQHLHSFPLIYNPLYLFKHHICQFAKFDTKINGTILFAIFRYAHKNTINSSNKSHVFIGRSWNLFWAKAGYRYTCPCSSNDISLIVLLVSLLFLARPRMFYMHFV